MTYVMKVRFIVMCALMLQDLPKTSYFKLIDFWLLFNVTVLALIMVWHTYVGRILNSSTDTTTTTVKPAGQLTDGNNWPYISSSAKKTKTDQDYIAEAKRANRMGIILVSLLIVLFNLVFWIIGIHEYLRPAETYFDEE